MKPLTQEELKRHLDYDQYTGIFTWIVANCNRVRKGGIAGSVKKSGGKSYISIMVNKKEYYAHRLAFLYMDGSLPEDEVDHISGNGLNNTWKNIREVSGQENRKNRRLQRNNKSGCVGVSWSNRDKKWYTQIGLHGKRKFLGSFVKKEEAILARQRAGIEYGFHENHGTSRPL